MNVNQIEIALSQKISASSTNFDLLAASKALQLLKTNGVFVVSSFGGLPAAASNEGKIYFIEDIETVVWSNGTDWLRLLDKNTIQFQLWSWGSNGSGYLADGTVTNKCSPVREICSATDWYQASAGWTHTTAIKTSGQLWSWGNNTNGGSLGDGTTVSKCSPVREFCSATDWCQVSAGDGHTSAIKTSGQIWAWGSNSTGRLGDGTTVSKCSPVREICSATDWCGVSLGYRHTVAVKTAGQIWAWGSNDSGRLGDGTTVSKCSPVREICSATDWCQVSAGGVFTVAIKTTGQIWVWGSNSCGHLGDGTATDRCSPVREFCSATDWCQVNTGRYHSTAIKTSGQIWAWGNNGSGRLGDGTTVTSCSPVREICSGTDWCRVGAGINHTAAIKTSGEIWSWGLGSSGRLGDGTTVPSCSPVREISSSTDWYDVSASAFTVAIKLI
jgi:alpha-tubulin suppressor-like RCC1 family protein